MNGRVLEGDSVRGPDPLDFLSANSRWLAIANVNLAEWGLLRNQVLLIVFVLLRFFWRVELTVLSCSINLVRMG